MLRALCLCLCLLAGFLLTHVARADDFGSCTDPAYLAHFNDPRMTPQPCDQLGEPVTIHWRGGSAQLRAIHFRGTAITADPALHHRLQEAATAIGTAIDRMGGGLQLDDVTVLLTNTASPCRVAHGDPADKARCRDDMYTAHTAPVFRHECPVAYYKEGMRRSGDDFVFVLAHEVFHCIQWRNWPHMPNVSWLIEGSAEYFAYLAKPSVDHGWIETFDEAIPHKPLDRMSYDAVVWYLWLGDAFGPPRVREFIANAQASAAADIRTSQWHPFAKAYVAQSIHMPDGSEMQSNPRLAYEYAFVGNDTMVIPAGDPYTIRLAVFDFARDKSYSLSYTPLPADALHLWRLARGGQWVAPPARISTCAGRLRVPVTWTSTRSRELGTITVTAEPAETCRCPAGTWQETTESLRHAFNHSLLGTPKRYVSGTRILVLNPDHTGSFTYQDLMTEVPSHDGIETRSTMHGESHFTWSVTPGGTLRSIYVPGGRSLTIHTVHQMPNGSTVVSDNPGVATQSLGHRFRCEADTLYLTRPPLPAGMPAMYQRAGARGQSDMTFTRIGGGTP